MVENLTVHLGERSYPIHFGTDVGPAVRAEIDALLAAGRKVVVVTDRNLARSQPEALHAMFGDQRQQAAAQAVHAMMGTLQQPVHGRSPGGATEGCDGGQEVGEEPFDVCHMFYLITFIVFCKKKKHIARYEM